MHPNGNNGARSLRSSISTPRRVISSVGTHEIARVLTLGTTLRIFDVMKKGIIKNVDHVLAPIESAGEFNLLPVRATIAIILDRLLDKR